MQHDSTTLIIQNPDPIWGLSRLKDLSGGHTDRILDWETRQQLHCGTTDAAKTSLIPLLGSDRMNTAKWRVRASARGKPATAGLRFKGDLNQSDSAEVLRHACLLFQPGRRLDMWQSDTKATRLQLCGCLTDSASHPSAQTEKNSLS